MKKKKCIKIYTHFLTFFPVLFFYLMPILRLFSRRCCCCCWWCCGCHNSACTFLHSVWCSLFSGLPSVSFYRPPCNIMKYVCMWSVTQIIQNTRNDVSLVKLMITFTGNRTRMILCGSVLTVWKRPPQGSQCAEMYGPRSFTFLEMHMKQQLDGFFCCQRNFMHFHNGKVFLIRYMCEIKLKPLITLNS